MEEYARFVLNDASLSQAIKEVRHRLARAVPAEMTERMVRCRDIVGDVGRDTKTESEADRADASSVVVAARVLPAKSAIT